MAFGTFEILAGDFKIGNEHQFLNGTLILKKADAFLREKIPLVDVESVEHVSDEVVRKAGSSIGWGVAGAALAGPLGAIAGGLIGGKKNQVTFVCTLKDGRKFVGVITAKLYSKISAPFLLAG